MREQWIWSMSEHDRSDFLMNLRPGDIVTVHREGRCDIVGVSACGEQVEVRTQVGVRKMVKRISVTGRWL